MPSLQWSNPERHDGVKSLTPIPNEIYLDIFAYTRTTPFSQHILRNLSLVCRFFYATTISWIFEDINFIPKYKFYGLQTCRHQSLSRGIWNEDQTALDIAKYVRRCTFAEWDDIDLEQQERIVEAFPLHLKALRSMLNVREVSLFSTTFTRGLLKSIGMLSRLESLKLRACSLAESVLPRHLSQLSSLKLKTLHHASFTNFRPDLPILDHLDLNFLEDVQSSDDHLLRLLLRLEGEIPLVKAVFETINDDHDLVSLLSKTPALKLLHVHWVQNSQSSLQLGTCLLPKLESLRAPVTIFNALIAMGHVQEASFSPRTTPQEFQNFQQPANPYKMIYVPAEVYLAVPFWKHFPALTTLHIDFNLFVRQAGWHRSQTHEELYFVTSKWPIHPPALRTLFCHLDFWPTTHDSAINLHRQYHWLVDILFPRFPTIRECHFDDLFTWFYVEEDAKWKSQFNTGQESKLQVGRLVSPYNVDHDGYIDELQRLSIGISKPDLLLVEQDSP